MASWRRGFPFFKEKVEERMMNIHYFQRYHNKENVVTANTMLLLSRLYNYSSDKFYRLLKTYFFGESFEPEISFALQERSDESVPDAAILQPSFKIIVETKLHLSTIWDPSEMKDTACFSLLIQNLCRKRCWKRSRR